MAAYSPGALKTAKPALSLSRELKGQELLRRGVRYCAVDTTIARCGLALALTLAAPGPARAQTPTPTQKPCSEPGDSSKTLSDKLGQGGGVICPPNVDPGMKAPAPDTGKMPVIPPPGSPGGDPSVQPK